jgi:hypothetical protein
MRNNTKIEPSQMRVADVEWMQLAYDRGTVSGLTHTIMKLRVSLGAGKTFVSWPSVGYCGEGLLYRVSLVLTGRVLASKGKYCAV